MRKMHLYNWNPCMCMVSFEKCSCISHSLNSMLETEIITMSTSTTEVTTKNSLRRSSSTTPSWFLSKHRDRKWYLLRLSFVPILICVLAFARSAFYRITYTPPECNNFGWFSSSSGEFQCDYKPLDLHATLALAWLTIFSLQVTLMAAGFNQAHVLFGKYFGFVGAFANAAGMFWLAFQDTFVQPMNKTDRPPDFTPFMFLVAIKLTICLVFAVRAVSSKNNKNSRDIEAHMLWIYRGFVTSFTTPVIRFYPAVLRHVIGDDCFQEHRDKFVMGAMFVSEFVCVVVYSLAQIRTQRTFWDNFMKIQAVTFLAALFKEIQFASQHGTFVGGMLSCAAEKFM